MSQLRITVSIPQALRQAPEPLVQQAERGGVFEIAETIADLARQNAPSGARGLLRANIRTEVVVTSSGVTGVVFTTSAVPHARFVELGTRPRGNVRQLRGERQGRGGREGPFIRELKLWARRVLGNERAAYAVRWKIIRQGTPAQRFLGRAVDAVRGRVDDIFAQHIAALIRSLRGN